MYLWNINTYYLKLLTCIFNNKFFLNQVKYMTALAGPFFSPVGAPVLLSPAIFFPLQESRRNLPGPQLIFLLLGLNTRTFCTPYKYKIVEHTKWAVEIRHKSIWFCIWQNCFPEDFKPPKFPGTRNADWPVKVNKLDRCRWFTWPTVIITCIFLRKKDSFGMKSGGL